MKLENNSINRAKFFAQYIGGDIIFTKTNQLFTITGVLWDEIQINDENYGTYSSSNFTKPLTALEDLTEEDAREIWRLAGVGDSAIDVAIKGEGVKRLAKVLEEGIDEQISSDGWEHSYQVVDELRRRGYLVPFGGYTRKELVEMGWASIKRISSLS